MILLAGDGGGTVLPVAAPSTLAFVLQLAAGGGVVALVQFVRYVIRHRPEVRALDADTDATLLSSARAASADVIDEMRERMGELAEENRALRLGRSTMELEAATGRRVQEQLTAKVDWLEQELHRATREIEGLRRRLGPLGAPTQEMPRTRDDPPR